MPNRKYAYADMEKFRKTTNAQKKRYYNKTNFHCSNVWTAEQDKMVLEHLITDTELSKIIQHSVKAIQVRRCRLKKKIRKGSYDPFLYFFKLYIIFPYCFNNILLINLLQRKSHNNPNQNCNRNNRNTNRLQR